jgi:hypothetical protein
VCGAPSERAGRAQTLTHTGHTTSRSMLSLIIHPGSFPLKVELSSGDLDKERNIHKAAAADTHHAMNISWTNVLIASEPAPKI